MEFFIDNRESTKPYFLKKKNEENLNWIHFDNLDLGDYIVKYKNETVVIIERKSIDDLANSIKDGRYREQKSRLFQNYPQEKIMYLIEGDLTKPNKSIQFNKVSKNTIYSSLLNLLLRDNLNLFITNNKQETIEFLENLILKINKNGIRFLKKKKYSKDEHLFQNLKSSKKNITPMLVYKLQLSSIPGISSKIADVIIQKYPTLMDFIEELHSYEDSERFEIIKNIKYESNGKMRRIGKKIATNLNKYLFSVPTDSDNSTCNTSTSISGL